MCRSVRAAPLLSPPSHVHAPLGQMLSFMKTAVFSHRHVIWNDVCQSVALTHSTFTLNPSSESRYDFKPASVKSGESLDANTLASRPDRFAAWMPTPTPRPVMADDFPVFLTTATAGSRSDGARLHLPLPAFHHVSEQSHFVDRYDVRRLGHIQVSRRSD